LTRIHGPRHAGRAVERKRVEVAREAAEAKDVEPVAGHEREAAGQVDREPPSSVVSLVAVSAPYWPETSAAKSKPSAQTALNKLARTFAAQVEALKRYRSGGQQKMTVQHAHVAEGGQAIVGNVTSPAEGVGARKKPEDQPHALAYAPGVEMPRHVEKEREAVPIAGGAGM
jgi:hypothetical protein